jgi:hypothetical protein
MSELIAEPLTSNYKTLQPSISGAGIMSSVGSDIMIFEDQINSNNFNAFDLHIATKRNSLYFMMQYTF